MIAEIRRIKDDDARAYAASMGPRSNDRGNLVSHVIIPAMAGLQWGRDLMIAEMSQKWLPQYTEALLQWGRDLMIAEMAERTRDDCPAVKLQWGRDLMIAEIRLSCDNTRNGTRLQWGRDLMIAEMLTAPGPGQYSN